MPKELVRKIVEYLMCPQTLEIEFDLSVEDDCLIEAALKTKSHKADGWYEMYGGVKINTTEDAVFLDLDFDYGS